MKNLYYDKYNIDIGVGDKSQHNIHSLLLAELEGEGIAARDLAVCEISLVLQKSGDGMVKLKLIEGDLSAELRLRGDFGVADGARRTGQR